MGVTYRTVPSAPVFAALGPSGRMSEAGQSRHFGRRPTTSGLPLETDIVGASFKGARS
jgi:hypothetical protein